MFMFMFSFVLVAVFTHTHIHIYIYIYTYIKHQGKQQPPFCRQTQLRVLLSELSDVPRQQVIEDPSLVPTYCRGLNDHQDNSPISRLLLYSIIYLKYTSKWCRNDFLPLHVW